jgi:(2Fe-2S) ferredoxin
MKYEKHLFVCTNERADKSRKCCGSEHGLMLVAEFKRQIKDRGLSGRIRAQRAGCFDTCEFGPAVVVYPEGIFYGNVSIEDVEEIVEKHLVKNCPLQRLMINFDRE